MAGIVRNIQPWISRDEVRLTNTRLSFSAVMTIFLATFKMGKVQSPKCISCTDDVAHTFFRYYRCLAKSSSLEHEIEETVVAEGRVDIMLLSTQDPNHPSPKEARRPTNTAVPITLNSGGDSGGALSTEGHPRAPAPN